MSMEKAKQCVEGYYRIRTRYANEFFDKLIPNAKDYLQSKNLAYVLEIHDYNNSHNKLLQNSAMLIWHA